MHCGFVVIVNGLFGAVLPPKAFERRNDVLEEAGDLMIAFVAHLDGIGYAIE